MKVGIETIRQLEELAKQQQRIFPDACDYGLWINSPKFKTYVRNLCKELRKDFVGKTEKWSCGCSWECFAPFEMEAGLYRGAKIKVSLNQTRKGKEFFSIDVTSHAQEKSGFRNDND